MWLKVKYLLKGLLILAMAVFWIFFCIVGEAIGCVLCLAGITLWLTKRAERKERELSGDFISYEGGYPALSEKELTKILIGEELRRMQYDRPVSKTAEKRRFIFTLAYALLNFVTLELWYCGSGILFFSSLLTLVYVLLLIRFRTSNVLCRCAKAAPGKSFRDVIREEVYEKDYNHTGRRVLMVGVLAVSVAGFFCLHAAPRWNYIKNEMGYTLKQYRPALSFPYDVQIPEMHEGQPVTAIGDRAFSGQSFLEGVSVPDSVLTIGKRAFRGCSSLKSVSLGSNLQSIGSGAFKRCKALEQIQLPQSLTELLGESFQDCSKLQSITIPEGVTEIRGNTFENCSALTQVQLHEGIIDIHAYAFRGCSALKQIQLPPKITEIHANTFENCTSLEEIDIPVGVTRIAAHAFYGCSALSSVYVPDTVVEIGSSAFRECKKLESIELPDNVDVNERAFKDSPTKVEHKRFTDEDVARILEEINSREVSGYYYVYDPADPDEVVEWQENTVIIADDPSFEDRLPEGKGFVLQVLEGEAELLAYLEKVKAAGIDNAIYAAYSQIATDICAEPWFSGNSWTVGDMIETCKQIIAEKENG